MRNMLERINIKSLKETISDIIDSDRELNEAIGTAMHTDTSIRRFFDSYMDDGIDKRYGIYTTSVQILVTADGEAVFKDNNGVITSDADLTNYVKSNESMLDGYFVDGPVDAVAHAMANAKTGRMNAIPNPHFDGSKNAVFVVNEESLNTIFIFAYFPAFEKYIGMYRKGDSDE